MNPKLTMYLHGQGTLVHGTVRIGLPTTPVSVVHYHTGILGNPVSNIDMKQKYFSGRTTSSRLPWVSCQLDILSATCAPSHTAAWSSPTSLAVSGIRTRTRCAHTAMSAIASSRRQGLQKQVSGEWRMSHPVPANSVHWHCL
jgi:hypothetical protein